MAKEEAVEAEGVVIEAVRNKFKVKISSIAGQDLETEHIASCYPGGRVRKNFIRIVPGDRVKLALSPYDLMQGRITYRYK